MLINLVNIKFSVKLVPILTFINIGLNQCLLPTKKKCKDILQREQTLVGSWAVWNDQSYNPWVCCNEYKSEINRNVE